MAWYNTTFIDNSSGPAALLTGIVDNSSGWFFGALMIFIWLILFVRFRNNGAIDASLAASFIVTVLSGLAFGLGAISATYLVFPASILVVSIIVKVWGDG